MRTPRFDWDPAKARINEAEHRVTFEQAILAFDDPFALIAADERHSTSAVFTVRDEGEIVRLISARRANRKERAIYEAYKGIPVP